MIMITTFSLPIKETLFLVPSYWFSPFKKKKRQSSSLRHNFSTPPEIDLFNYINLRFQSGIGHVTRNEQVKDGLIPRHAKGLHIHGHGLFVAFFPLESKPENSIRIEIISTLFFLMALIRKIYSCQRTGWVYVSCLGS